MKNLAVIKLFIGLSFILSLSTINAQSLGYSGGLCVGSSIDIFLMGGPNCGSPNVSSQFSWNVSPTPSSIQYLNSNKTIRVTWNSAVSATVYVNYGCDFGGSSGTTDPLWLTINNSVTPAVSLAVSGAPVCEGGSVLFTATPTNGGGSPFYGFYVDGVSVYNGYSNSYSYSTAGLSSGSHSVYVAMSSSLACTTPSSAAQSTTQNFTVNAKANYSALIHAPEVVCSGTSTITAVVTVSGTFGNLSYEWFINGAPQWGGSSLDVSVNEGTNIYCKVHSDGCVNTPAQTSTYTINITSSVTPTVGIQIPKQNFCPGENINFTATSAYITGGSSYQWRLNGNVLPYTTSSISLPASASVVPNTFYNGSVVEVTVSGLSGTCLSTTSAVGTTSGSGLNVYPQPVPTFSGSSSTCVNSTGNTYTTEAGMSNYQWTVSAGGTVTAGGNSTSNSVTVTWNSASAQSVSVNYTNGNGCTAPSPSVHPVTVNPRPTPSITSGPTTVCNNSSSAYVTQTGMTGYTWSVTGGTVTSGQGTNSATVAWSTSGSQTVSVHYTDGNGCASVTPGSTSVTVNARPVASISGSLTACVNTTAVYTTENGMSGYNWTVIGGNVFSGQGTYNPVIMWTSTTTPSVSVSYTGTNGCSTLNPSTLGVSVSPRPTPSITSGSSTVCSGTNNLYSTQAGMSAYSWSAANGTIVSGQGTSDATISWASSGGPYAVSIQYTDASGCASVNPGTTSVTVNSSPSPTVTGGPLSVCVNSTGNAYSTQAGMSNYIWSAPGGTITSGQGTETATITWTQSGTPNLSISYTGSNGCPSQNPGLQPVNVYDGSTSVPVIGGNARIGPGTLLLTASGALTGETYKWFDPSDVLQITGSSYPTPTVNATTANYAYVKIESPQGCPGQAVWFDVTIHPLPVISSSAARVYMGSSATLTATAGFDTYDWQLNSNSVGSGNASFSTSLAGTYWLTVTKAGLGSASTSFVLASQFSDVNENYIISNTLLKEGITSDQQVPDLSADANMQSIQYFDGLGRPIQTVSTQASPGKQDIVQHIEYDAFGREAIKYLPFASTQDDGLIKSNAQIEQLGFYSVTGTIANDPNPYAVTHFEPSPLNRVLEQGAPGSAWQPDQTDSYTSTDRTIKKSYEFNGAAEVVLWIYTPPDANHPFGQVSVGPPALRYYFPNQLYKNKTKDEEHHEVIEYVDKQGRTILKSVQADGSTYAHTYYIYDDFGNLVFVLSPEAVAQLTNQF